MGSGVTQMVELSLPIPEVHSSNPVIGKFYIEHLFTVNCIERTKVKKKRPGMAIFIIILRFVEAIGCTTRK